MGKKTQKKGNLNYRSIIAIIGIIAIIVAIVLIVTTKNKKNNEEQQVETYQTTDTGTKYNTSKKLQETKTFEGYEISNIALSETEGEADFSAKIKNVTENTIGKESIYIIFKKQSGEELYKMETYVSEIKPGKSININSKITKDVVEAYDIEIKKK